MSEDTERKRLKLIRWFIDTQKKYPKIHIYIDIHTSSIEKLEYNEQIITREIEEQKIDTFCHLLSNACEAFVEHYRRTEEKA